MFVIRINKQAHQLEIIYTANGCKPLDDSTVGIQLKRHFYNHINDNIKHFTYNEIDLGITDGQSPTENIKLHKFTD